MIYFSYGTERIAVSVSSKEEALMAIYRACDGRVFTPRDRNMNADPVLWTGRPTRVELSGIDPEWVEYIIQKRAAVEGRF